MIRHSLERRCWLGRRRLRLAIAPLTVAAVVAMAPLAWAQRPTRTPINPFATNTPDDKPTRTPIQPRPTRTPNGGGDPTETPDTVEGTPTRTRTPGENTSTATRTRPGGGPTATRTTGGNQGGTPTPTSRSASTSTKKATNTRKPTNTPRPVVQDVFFRAGREFDAGAAPSNLAIGDFNHDGFQDIAIVSRTRNKLSILLGASGSSFTSGPGTPSTGREPVAILATDLDGDDNIDLVTADATDGTVSTYLNDGGAHFVALSHTLIDGEPSALVEYGERVAVADRLNSRVVLLHRASGGRLEFDEAIPCGQEPIAIGAGDFDRDGLLDLATANDVGQSVSVMYANESGFDAPRSTNLGAVPGAFSVGDFDVDGFADFAVTLPLIDTVRVYRRLPDRDEFTLAFEAKVPNRPSTILLANDTSVRVTGDSLPDLLVLSDENAVMTLFAGLGPDTVPPFELTSRFTVGRGPVALATTEVDRDSGAFADILVVERDADKVMLLRGRGEGSFLAAVTVRTDIGPLSITAGDFDGDAKMDIVTANLNAGTVSFLKGNGLGGLRPPSNVPVLTAPSLVGAGEFTGDAELDLVVASTISTTAAIYAGDGMGGFSGVREIFLAGAPAALWPGDLNDDGELDIAFADRDSGNVDVFINLRDSGFPAYVLPATGPPTDVVIADVNNDDLMDVVAVVPSTRELNVWFQLQDGRFDGPDTFSTGAVAEHFVLADLDGDGTLDAVTANHDASTMSVMLGSGGGFRSPQTVSLENPPVRVLAIDLNLDGAVDLVTLSDVTGEVTALSGDGRGGFSRRATFAAGVEPQALLAAQVNNDPDRGDRLPDVVVADYLTDRVTVLRNSSDAPPATATPRPTSTLRPVDTGGGGGGGCQAAPDNGRDALILIAFAAVALVLVRYSKIWGARA